MNKRSADAASALDARFMGTERIVVLHGKELFLQGELMVRLRQSLESRTGGEVEVVRYEGSRAGLADVLDELRSFGLMAQHKLVVVTEAEEFVKKHREPLERYAQEPVETATLLLRSEGWNKGNLDKAIEKVGRIIKCDEPSRAQVEAWLTHRAGEGHKVKIGREAMAQLVEHIGLDLGRLDSELGKVAVGVEPGETISGDQVRAIVGHASDDAAWAIQDALLTGSAQKSLQKLHELVDLAGADLAPIAWAVSDLLRKLHYAAGMAAAGGNPFSIGSKLKVWPPERHEPFVEVARRLGPERSAALLATSIEMDRRSKSGFAEALINIERLCVRFAGALRS